MPIALERFAVHAEPDTALGGIEAAHLGDELIEGLTSEWEAVQHQQQRRRNHGRLAAELHCGFQLGSPS